MLNKDLLVPALIGLGLYSQANEVSLANNTSILLILFLLLKGECHGKHHHPHHHHHRRHRRECHVCGEHCERGERL